MTGSAGAISIGRRAVYAAYYAFVFWIPLETIFVINSGAESPITVSRLLGVVLFGLALLNWRICFRRFPAAFWMVAWYLAAFCLSQLWVPGELDTGFLAAQITLAQMVLLFLISINLFEDAGFRANLMRFYGWWMSIVAAGMVLGVWGAQFRELEGRSSILEQDPNVAAGLFALGAVCIAGDPMAFAFRRFAARVLPAVAAVAVLILAILQTGSRGGLLAFVAGVFGLLMCGRNATRKRRVAIASIVIILLAVMVVLEFQKGTDTAFRLERAWRTGDTAQRMDIWKLALAMFLDRPLLGYGGTHNFVTLGGFMDFVSLDTHNLFLAVLTEVGLIGAAPFILALLNALWKTSRYGRRTGDALPFALMCALITINLALTGYHQKVFWIVFAVAVACGLESGAAGRLRRTLARGRT
jgi:O-antigen ligase